MLHACLPSSTCNGARPWPVASAAVAAAAARSLAARRAPSSGDHPPKAVLNLEKKPSRIS